MGHESGSIVLGISVSFGVLIARNSLVDVIIFRPETIITAEACT